MKVTCRPLPALLLLFLSIHVLIPNRRFAEAQLPALPEACAGAVGCDGICGSGKVVGCDGLCGSGKIIGGCDNQCGSTRAADECGVCGGPGINPQTGCCPGLVKGCDGVCGSGKLTDACGVCGGPGASTEGCCFGQTKGCDGVCGSGKEISGCDNQCGSTKSVDECGICGGPGLNPATGCCGEEIKGCDGVCGSDEFDDICGVCGGDGTSCCGVKLQTVIRARGLDGGADGWRNPDGTIIRPPAWWATSETDLEKEASGFFKYASPIDWFKSCMQSIIGASYAMNGGNKYWDDNLSCFLRGTGFTRGADPKCKGIGSTVRENCWLECGTDLTCHSLCNGHEKCGKDGMCEGIKNGGFRRDSSCDNPCTSTNLKCVSDAQDVYERCTTEATNTKITCRSGCSDKACRMNCDSLYEGLVEECRTALTVERERCAAELESCRDACALDSCKNYCIDKSKTWDSYHTLYFTRNDDGTCSATATDPGGVCELNASAAVYLVESPISLLLEGSDLPQPVTVSFPLDPAKKGYSYEWHASASAPLLVFDPAHTGKISDGTQLFGNSTFGRRWANGYLALGSKDVNHNGVLEEAELSELGLWFDQNRDGVSDPGEVKSLADAKIKKLFYTKPATVSATGDLRMEVGFEREVSGNTVTGPSIDWFGQATKPAESARMSGADSTQTPAKSLSPAAPEKLKGAWHWQLEGVPGPGKPYGIITFEPATKQFLRGASLVELDGAEKATNKPLRVLTRHLLLAEALPGDEVQFQVGSKRYVTESRAALGADGILRGISRTVKDGRRISSYSWTARRISP